MATIDPEEVRQVLADASDYQTVVLHRAAERVTLVYVPTDTELVEPVVAVCGGHLAAEVLGVYLAAGWSVAMLRSGMGSW